MTNITQFDTSFNSYHVIGILGEGGSGRVYKVTDDNGSLYAIKCLDANKATTEKRKRFKHEISFCQKISHRNIVPILEYGLAQIKGKNCPFYVMPCYSSTLRDLLKKGILPEKVVGYFSQILDGVEAAHLKSVWHRDLKPENILYAADTDTLLIADFGIAHFGEEYLLTTLVTSPQTRLANFQYSAPEQRIAGSTVGYKADIFSLGLILNEMFTGHVLQGSGFTTIASVAPDFSYLDEIVEGMVKQDPNNRYKSIDAVKQKLIANRNDFVSRQRLSELANTVISESDIDDPLIIEPMRVTDVDYKSGKLIFTLNHATNTRWKDALNNIGNYKYYAGFFEPQLVTFRDKQAIISIPSYTEPDQSMVEMFKDYVIKANASYKESLEREQRQREAAERKRLQDETEEEKKRQKIRQNLKL